jgi:hypothetical protein
MRRRVQWSITTSTQWAGDEAIRRPEVRRTVPGPIEDEQLVLDEHGFGDHGPRIAGAGESSHRRQQMEEQDRQVTHAPRQPTTRDAVLLITTA